MKPTLNWSKSKAEAYAPGAAPKGQSMITKRDLMVGAVNRGVPHIENSHARVPIVADRRRA